MFRHLISLAWLLAMVCLVSVPGRAQSSDPQAVALASQALNALTGGTQVNDVILQASGTFIAGSDQELGPATLEAKRNSESRVILNLTGGTRQEIRNGPAGAWIGPDGTPHAMALHNCWFDANWFFPTLTLQALQADPTLGVVYLGPAAWNGLAALHLQFFHIVPGQAPEITTQIQSLSAVHLFVDAKSLLPLAVDFNLHADNDLNVNIPVEIQFGNYQTVSGVLVPFHIQKYLQGTLTLDLLVTNSAINSGLPDSIFMIQPTAGGQS